MEGNSNSNQNEAESRWTCEACGCNTNASSDRACSICGTSSGPSILRRAGYSARDGIFGRGGLPVGLSFGGGRGEMNADIDELWGRAGFAAEEDEAMAALAMEVSGHPMSRNRETGRQRLLDAARSFSMAGRDSSAINTEGVMEAATENASSFQPRWIQPSQVAGRATTGNGIEVGEGERQSVAHLPIGAGEGRPVRTAEAIPRSIPFAALVPSSRERRSRRSFGFRVAFDYPEHDAGRSLGGGHMVGVTTSSFSSFGERNGLQQSALFWGIDDGGNKFEGSRYGQTSRGGRRGISNYAMEIRPDEAPLNSDDVLFGAREIVTGVVDFETRTLTFWRNDQLLGTLVSNLPRGSALYPVAVPSRAGTTVAITGMDGDPLVLLRTFSAGWRQEQQRNDAERRQKLQVLRSSLIRNGAPTPELTEVLKMIFSSYAKNPAKENGEVQLGRVEAGRLWYRCNMKLNCIDSYFIDDGKSYVTFEDFTNVIRKIICEDEEIEPCAEVLVGDRVELVDGYETKGDAAAGPMQPGDRGIVIELQQGPNGERHSVRVFHGGRRWWYQPQAILSERSGLIESSSIWFLHKALRAHGFDHATLKSLVGKPVTDSSWEFGDIVVPRKISPALEPGPSLKSPMDSIVGRIVVAASRNRAPASRASASARSAEPATVHVEFVNENFIVSTGLPVGTEVDEFSGSLATRRVRVNKLLHSSCFEGVSVLKTSRTGKQKSTSDETDAMSDSFSPDDENLSFSEDIVSDKIKKDIEAIAKLDRSAIDAITKECRSNPGSLPSLFSAGLPEAIIAALDSCLEEAKAGDLPPSFTQTMAALAGLVVRVADQLFVSENDSTFDDDDIISTEDGTFDNNSGDETMDDAASTESDSRQQNDGFGQAIGLSEAGWDDATTLQQRRSMLLALMSRARRSNTGSLNEIVERENGELGLGQVVPGIHAMRQGQPMRPFFSGFSADILRDRRLDDSAGGAARENGRPFGGQENSLQGQLDQERAVPSRGDVPSFLLSVLQGSSGNNCSIKPAGDSLGAPLSLTRCLFFNGLLSNSLPWVEGAVEMQARRRPLKPSQQQRPVLQKTTDEDGLPVLLVAISLGCSLSIIKCLIQAGAPVREEEVRIAAYTNQSDSLAALLLHKTYSADMVDLGKCSQEICDVVERAANLQSELKQKMSEKTGNFVSDLWRRLVRFGLECRTRRHESAQLSLCSEIVSGVLSGYALLRAFQKSQVKPGSLKAQSQTLGLLGVVSSELLAEALFRDTRYITMFLLLIEDHLLSKGVYDGCVGLTLLRSLLEKFPFLNSSTEMDRYGFADLAARHGSMASSRLEKASSQAPSDDMEGQSSSTADGSILCPAKHVAVLHITKHSSFRCDLCGMGVERGRQMHGCRECDWDACEKCTGHRTAFVKNTHLKNLSEEAELLLSKDVAVSDECYADMCVEDILQKMSSLDSTPELHNLSICLQQQDILASRKLAAMLESPGRITVNQFTKMVLPPLHAALLGKASETGRPNVLHCGSGHRNKKAKVGGGSFRQAEVATETAKSLLNLAGEGDTSDSNSAGDRRNASESSPNSEIPGVVARLQQILSFYETVSSDTPPQSTDALPRGALKSLIQPISIELRPSTLESPTCLSHSSSLCTKIHAEPLVSIDQIELHILKTCKLKHPSYISFCRRLATDHAIIVEQARSGGHTKWGLGRIISYDDELGSHTIQYALPWTQGSANSSNVPELKSCGNEVLDGVKFEGDKKRLILAAREYYILRRQTGNDDYITSSSPRTMEITHGSGVDRVGQRRTLPRGAAVGMRVETSAFSNEVSTHTIIAIDQEKEQPFVLVSESGEVWESSASRLKFPTETTSQPTESGRGMLDRGRQDRNPMGRSFPFLSREVDRTPQRSSDNIGRFRRTWSALSLMESMRPIELSARDGLETSKDRIVPGRGLHLSCTQGMLAVNQASIEVPPLLCVEFSVQETLPTVNLQSKRGMPLIGAVTQLIRKSDPQRIEDYAPKTAYTLYYLVSFGEHPGKDEYMQEPQFSEQSTNVFHFRSSTANALQTQLNSPGCEMINDMGSNDNGGWMLRNNRSRKLSLTPAFGEDDSRYQGLCDGLNEICVQCMEVLGMLSENSEKPNVSGHKSKTQSFENINLSKELEKELDDPLTVAGSALAEWVTVAPMFAPRLFSYASRRLLLERSAFGVSRSVFKQQEAKVNVGRLRQRMAALRGRAVELVGEAFSSGAEDPTSLQLQADELYGMEESLGNRVKAAFRSEQWEEHALEVAKVAVERACLLSDADKIMQKISMDDRISSRRLEIRFENESGFDAASGPEAGVTRGFYADVAEALLSCENVAGVYCSPGCPKDSLVLNTMIPIDPWKLPLFIPDMDSMTQVIIPTPRSDPRSELGVFPRALSRCHPQFGEVVARYRLIGRLFAAAMRDGFMFPVPLSSSFLKLVQQCRTSDSIGINNCTFVSEKDSLVVPRKTCSALEDLADDVILGVKGSAISDPTILSTLDLPRPGFLGGEVYAVELHVCRALDRIDATDPPMNRHDIDIRYQEIATDKNFARVALGKAYDCSFEDYFQDRTFVDPLDPTQGEEAAPLCSGGHKKQVTIYNIRDWVALAKQFLLHDGVLAQAQAFRSGVDDFFSSAYLRLFTPEELQRDVCGVGDNVDSWTEPEIRKLIKLDGGKGAHEALVAVAAIGGEGGAALSRRFSTTSPTINFLVKALLEASPTQRRRFLSFVTSVPIVTPGKFEVVPIVSPSGEFMPMQDPGVLPRSNTCARRLYLPKFESYESFAAVLWAVVREESKFKGFFEWRGS